MFPLIWLFKLNALKYCFSVLGEVYKTNVYMDLQYLDTEPRTWHGGKQYTYRGHNIKL